MAKPYAADEDDDCDWDDPEAPDESDRDDGDDPELVPCPYCKEGIPEDAERCPYCGSYVSREDAPRRRPWFVVGILVLVAAIFLMWVVKRF